MIKILRKLIGMIMTIVMIPIALVIAIPIEILKARRAKKSRLLFTGMEQALLGKAQRVINMDKNGLISPDRDLLDVAKCIENARCDYQIIKGRERFDSTFSEFVLLRIYNCHVVDWGNVINFFELSALPAFEETDRFIEEDVDGGMPYDDLYEETEMLEDKNDIVVIVAQGVNSRISSEKVALQFVLEELDAARKGNKTAVQFVKNSGFSPSEYEGALQNSFEEVDGPDGPQQFLLSTIMKFSSDMDFMVNLRLKVVEKIIHDWGLNKKKKGRDDKLLKSLRNILEDDSSIMPQLTKNIPAPASARIRHVYFRKQNIDSARNIVSTLIAITGDDVDTIIKNALQLTSQVDGELSQDDIVAKLTKLSESKNIKTCKMSIQPINEIWNWEFEFSDDELEVANDLVSVLLDVRNGDFTAIVYKFAKEKQSSLSSFDDFDEDIPF